VNTETVDLPPAQKHLEDADQEKIKANFKNAMLMDSQKVSPSYRLRWLSIKVRQTRNSGVAKAEAYIGYVEHFATRYDTEDRTFATPSKFR